MAFGTAITPRLVKHGGVAKPPAKRLGRPKDGDSTETRQRIISEARQIFAEQGFRDTTNKEIAARVGITPGAIYHYVSSKAELYVEVYEAVQSDVADVFAKSLVGRVGLLDSVSAILDAAVVLNEHDPSLAGFLFGVARDVQRHPEVRHRFRARGLATAQLIHRLVDEAVATGEVAAEQRRAIEDMLGAVLNGLLRFSSLIEDPGRQASAVDVLKQLFAGTLVRPVDRGPSAIRSPG